MEKAAFTLAEVLITLGIIGVVAALTLPTLIQNYKEKQTVVKLKKTYSILENAFSMLKTLEHDGNGIKNWQNPENFTSDLTKYLQISKYCPLGEGFECFQTPNNIKTIIGKDDVLIPTGSVPAEGIILNDGTTLLVNNFYAKDQAYFLTSGNYAQIFIDINGKNQPNKLGEDIFAFFVTDTKLKPTATGSVITDEEQLTDSAKGHLCKPDSNAHHNGLDCTAWVLYNGNMDYLKYFK